MTVVTNDFFQDIDTDKLSSMDLDGQIKELDSAAKELMSGTNTLYAGIHKLSTSSAALSTGVSKLNKGASDLSLNFADALSGSLGLEQGTAEFSEALSTNLEKMKTGVAQLSAGSSKLATGAADLKKAFDTGDGTEANPGVLAVSDSIKNGVADLQDGIVKAKGASLQYLNAAKDALEGLKTAGEITDEEYDSITGAIDKSIEYQNMIKVDEKLIAGTAGLDSGLNAIYTEITVGDGTEENPGLVNGTAAVQAGVAGLQKGLDDATAETKSLTSNANEIAAGAKKLAAGQTKLAAGAEELAAGMSQLNDNSGLDAGSKTLNEGMQKFYQQGIAKIVSLYNSELKGTVNSADAVIKAGKQYNTFTQVPDGMDGSVKFIYRTKVAD